MITRAKMPTTVLKPWWREERPGCSPTIWGTVDFDTREFYDKGEEICCVRVEEIEYDDCYVITTAGMTILRLYKNDEINERPS